MAKFYHSDIQDFGISRPGIKAATNTIILAVLKNYATTHSFATATANIIGSTSLAPGDLVISNGANASRSCAVSAKTITLTGSSTVSDDLHVAILDNTESKILVVTDETSNQALTSGNSFLLPSWAFTSGQPV
jgi:hypothetical protein